MTASLKVVLAVVGGHAADRAVLETARTLAVRFGAHIDVLHVRADPYALPYLDAGVAPSVTASLLAAIDAQIQARRNMAWDTFGRWRDAAKLTETEPSAPDVDRPTIRWIERKGNESEISAQGRFTDLIVLSQPSRAQEDVTTAFLAGSFESALFGTPRPVLVVPEGYDGQALLNAPAAIAWNGSLEADRALGAALALLAHAGRATVIISEEPGRRHAPDVAELRAYLKRHGIDVQVVGTKAESTSVGAVILKSAEDAGAGLLVMGAYTHSRLREFVLGGATNYVSTHARIPVLMVH
jgi:nucleotide-binding universal stress UspA family protein